MVRQQWFSLARNCERSQVSSVVQPVLFGDLLFVHARPKNLPISVGEVDRLDVIANDIKHVNGGLGKPSPTSGMGAAWYQAGHGIALAC